MIAEHAYYAVTQVDGKTGKHPTHLGIQWRERFQNKRVWELLFWFGGMAHDDLFKQTKTGSPIIRLGLCQIANTLIELLQVITGQALIEDFLGGGNELSPDKRAYIY